MPAVRGARPWPGPHWPDGAADPRAAPTLPATAISRRSAPATASSRSSILR